MSTHFTWDSERRLPRSGALKTRGLTVVELLIACGLFLLVTLTFFQIFSPAMRRFGKSEGKQDILQKFIVLKERMTYRLGNAILLNDRVTSDSVEFYSPHQVDSPVGRLNCIDSAEMIDWNESFHCSFSVKQVAGENLITETSEDGERTIWNLGKEGTLNFSFQTAPEPLLVTELYLPDGDNLSGQPWEKSFSIYIRNFK
jgi:type II secretory pathway component PulJ